MIQSDVGKKQIIKSALFVSRPKTLWLIKNAREGRSCAWNLRMELKQSVIYSPFHVSVGRFSADMKNDGNLGAGLK